MLIIGVKSTEPTIRFSSTSLALGLNATNGAFTQSLAIGNGATNTANNQAVVGSTTTSITSLVIGNGVLASSPASVIISPTAGLGTDIAGSNLTLSGGQSTGAGLPGIISFTLSIPTASSSTLNARTEFASIRNTPYTPFNVSVRMPTLRITPPTASTVYSKLEFNDMSGVGYPPTLFHRNDGAAAFGIYSGERAIGTRSTLILNSGSFGASGGLQITPTGSIRPMGTFVRTSDGAALTAIPTNDGSLAQVATAVNQIRTNLQALGMG